MNIAILGPQGCGKGTQAKLLSEKFNLKHISTGELLRQEAEKDTPKGKLIADVLKTGALVPFDTVSNLLESAIKNSETGYILDGTPRDLSQAEYLQKFLEELGSPIDKVIVLNIPDSESEKRLALRSQKEGRSDDTPEAIKKRLSIYHQRTEPVIDYYRQMGKLVEIDGTPDINTIHQNIISNLGL